MSEVVAREANKIPASVVARENIRIECAIANIYQEDLARLLHLSQGAISSRFTGKVAWTLDELGTIADLLGVAMADLITPNPRVRRRLHAVTENTDEARGNSRASDRLPRLDSNQQPSDYMLGLVGARVLELPLRRDVNNGADVMGELAPVVSLESRLGA